MEVITLLVEKHMYISNKLVPDQEEPTSLIVRAIIARRRKWFAARRLEQLTSREGTVRFRKIQRETKALKLSKISQIAADRAASASVMRAPSPSSSPSSSPSPSHPISTHTPVLSSPGIIATQMFINEWRAKHADHLSREHKRQKTNRKKRERAARRLPPTWTKAKEIQRAPAYAAAILEKPGATAFTVNFSPELLERAQKAPQGAFHWLRSRITRELKKALGDSPSLTCALDTTNDGRLHIHGFVSWPSGDLVALRDALKRAAGKWAHRRGAGHQIRLRTDQCELIGEKISQVATPLTSEWGSYSIKHAKRLRNATNHSVLYSSPDIKRLADQSYTTTRNTK